jgi:hypothetical protein
VCVCVCVCVCEDAYPYACLCSHARAGEADDSKLKAVRSYGERWQRQVGGVGENLRRKLKHSSDAQSRPTQSIKHSRIDMIIKNRERLLCLGADLILWSPWPTPVWVCSAGRVGAKMRWL